MKPSDYLGFALSVGFGLWWAVFPRSVVSFYTWFHRGRVKMPGIFLVRLVGVLWILMVFIVTVISFRR
jgi:hypothetical protein